MIHIEGINITIMVSDLDKAIHFYSATLGLTLKTRYGNHWADIEGPGISIGLHPAEKSVIKGDNLQIGLKVTNLKEAITSLEKQGVKFNTNSDDQVKLAFFNDPDGNILYLVQP